MLRPPTSGAHPPMSVMGERATWVTDQQFITQPVACSAGQGYYASPLSDNRLMMGGIGHSSFWAQGPQAVPGPQLPPLPTTDSTRWPIQHHPVAADGSDPAELLISFSQQHSPPMPPNSTASPAAGAAAAATAKESGSCDDDSGSASSENDEDDGTYLYVSPKARPPGKLYQNLEVLIKETCPGEVLGLCRPKFNRWNKQWKYRDTLNKDERKALTRVRRKELARLAVADKRQKDRVGKTSAPSIAVKASRRIGNGKHKA